MDERTENDLCTTINGVSLILSSCCIGAIAVEERTSSVVARARE